MGIRRMIRRWVDQATNQATSPAQFAAMVDVANNQQQVTLPAGARALRFHGILDVGQMAGVSPTVGDQVSIQKTGRAYTNLQAGQSCNPGDLPVIANAAGDTVPYVFGTGTAQALGYYRTQYTNGQSAGVPVEYDQFPFYIIQTMEIRGFVRTPAQNNTRDIGNDCTEINGDEFLFTAPWNGTLQGPLKVDFLTGAGNTGHLTVNVRIKVPGSAWATAQVGSPAANWTTGAVDLSTFTANAEGEFDDTTTALPFGNSLAITKGTKVGFQLVKDGTFANVTQVQVRLAFW